MFCFLHLPYHPRSLVRVKERKARRLFHFHCAMQNINDLKTRRLFFRRCQSEPIQIDSCEQNFSSRTDPKWKVTVDSVSLQSSYLDYQSSRKNRLHKNEPKLSSLDMSVPNDTLSNCSKESNAISIPSSLDRDNDLPEHLMQKINYEQEIREFVENSTLLQPANIFADPFESDDRKSRIEKWIETMRSENNETDKNFESAEKTISSTVTVNSLKNSTLKLSLQAAIETQSEVDVREIDRFWDYLYTRKDNAHEITSKSSPEIAGMPHVENKISATEAANSESGSSEKCREVDEISHTDINYFGLEKITDQEKNNLPVVEIKEIEMKYSHNTRKRNVASQTDNGNSQWKIVQPNNIKNTEKINDSINQQITLRLFNDLQTLVKERDRAIVAMNLLPSVTLQELSDQCNYYQLRYRVQIELSKERLDSRIERIWRKLMEFKICDAQIVAFLKVSNSEELTLHSNRNIS